MFKNLIFDWSGTIVDDLGPVVAGTNRVLTSEGKPALDRESFRKTFQLPYGDWWAAQLPQLALTEVERLFRIGFSESTEDVPVLDHAREALEACKQAGVRLFVLSSMDEPAFQKQLEGHGMAHFFEATYVGVLDKREVIGELLTTHALEKDETAFIGDMTHDIDTANHAGVTGIAVMTGYNHPEVLVSSKPAIMLEDLRYLARFIQPVPSSESAIRVRGLEVSTHIGVPDEERATPQTLELDLDLFGVNSFSQMADDVGETINYHEICIMVEKCAAERPRKLIETLADDVADLILKDPIVRRVVVDIRKRILPQTDWVGCSLEKVQGH